VAALTARKRPASVRLASAARIGLTYLLLTVGAIGFVVPFLWMLGTSFRPLPDIMANPINFIPTQFHPQNYVEAWQAAPFGTFLGNTVTITVTTLIGDVASSAIVAYAFARIPFAGRGFWFIVLLSTLMLPPAVTLIPQFVMFRVLGWLNTFLPLIVPAFFGQAFYIFLFRQFFFTIPLELDEAAIIDGADHPRIFWSILLPLMRPALAAVAIFSFIRHWNDFLGPLIYLHDEDKMTLAVGLQLFRGQYQTQLQYLMAGSVLMVLPIIVIFFVAQKYFIQGIALSGIKG
jgi:multiple sugar transport system permease protein